MKILIASPIDPDVVGKLHEEHDVITAFGANEDELKKVIRDRQVLLFRSGVNITAGVMECAPDLRLLVRAGSGADNVDLEFIRHTQIEFVNIPEPAAKAVAEMSFLLMLALSRRLLDADRSTRQGRWAKYELAGGLLTRKTLGIVGTGNIGTRVGQLGAAWDMEVLGCVEHPSQKRAIKLREKGIRLTNFDEVISTADFVSVHVPKKDSTRNLIDARVLSRVKPGAFLINLARGGVLDEDALYHALTENRLRGAALDVHQEEGEGKISPLAALPNTILTPHIGSMTTDTQREIGCRICEIINSYSFQSEHPEYKVSNQAGVGFAG